MNMKHSKTTRAAFKAKRTKKSTKQIVQQEIMSKKSQNSGNKQMSINEKPPHKE